MKRPWIAAVLNFFFMGLGYLYTGKRPLLGAGLTIAALALTYVELQIKPIDPTLYGIMFGAVLLGNTVLAIDGYREAKAMSRGAVAPARA